MREITKKIISYIVCSAIILSLFTCYAFSEYGMENVPLNHGKTLDCFGWSYNNIKSNAAIIAESGYKSVMVSPLQSTKTNTSGLTFSEWEKMYESTKYDFGNSALGTQEDFSYMCKEMDKYGIQVIVQVVVGDSVSPDEGWDLPGFINAMVAHGADGVYFIGAEGLTVSDGYWTTLINDVNRYAGQFYGYGKTISFFAEVTDTAKSAFVAAGMSVVDDFGMQVLEADVLKIADTASSTNFDSSKIHRVESRVEYMADMANAPSVSDIAKAWALTAARKDCMSVYFSRPQSADTLLGSASTIGWNKADVQNVNKFANYFEGKEEYISSYSNNYQSFEIIERSNNGILVVKTEGTINSISATVNNLSIGTYTDQITGNTFTVSAGKLGGNIGSTGIATVYNPVPNCTHATHDTDGVCDVCKEMVGHSFVDGLCACGETENKTYKLYYDNSIDNWSRVNVYFWSDYDTTMTSWPGEPLTLTDDGLYEIAVDSEAQYVIFNNNGSPQTDDLNLTPCGIYKNSNVVGYRHNFSSKVCTAETRVPNSTVTEGIEYYYSCADNCGAISTDKTFVVGATCTHTMTYHEEIVGDCKTEGTKEHWECSECGSLFLDEAGTNRITWQSLKYYTEHNYGEDEICIICGALNDEGHVYLSAEHFWPSAEFDYAVWSWSNVNGIPSAWFYPDDSVSVEGYTAFKINVDCEMLIFAAFPKGSKIDWSNRKYQTENLILDAKKYYTLSKNNEESDGWSNGSWMSTPCVHNWEIGDNITDFDCTVAHDVVYSCSLCGVTHLKSVAATNHIKPTDESLITIVTPPTCEAQGELSYGCARCNKTITEPIDSIPHDVNEDKICSICGEAMCIEIITDTGTYYEVSLLNAFCHSRCGSVAINGGTVRLLDDYVIGGETILLLNDCDITFDLNGHSLSTSNSDGYFTVENCNFTVENGTLILNDDLLMALFVIKGKAFIENIEIEDSGTLGYLHTAFKGSGNADIVINNLAANTDNDILEISENATATVNNFTFSGEGYRNKFVVRNDACLTLGAGVYSCIRVAGTSNTKALCPTDGLCAQKEDGTYYDSAVFSAGKAGQDVVYYNVSIVTVPFTVDLVGDTPTAIKGFSCDLELTASTSEELTYSWSAVDPSVILEANGANATVTYPRSFSGDVTIKCSISHTNGYVKHLDIIPNVIDCQHENIDNSLVCNLCGDSMTLEFSNSNGTYYGTDLVSCYDKYLLATGGTIRLLSDFYFECNEALFFSDVDIVFDFNGYTLRCGESKSGIENIIVDNGHLTIKNGTVVVNNNGIFLRVNSGEALVENVTIADNGNSGRVVFYVVQNGKLFLNNVSTCGVYDEFLLMLDNGHASLTNMYFEAGRACNLLLSHSTTIMLGEGIYPNILIERSSLTNHIFTAEGFCAQKNDGTYYAPNSFGAGQYNSISIVPVPFTAEWKQNDFNIYAGGSVDLELAMSVTDGLTYNWSAADDSVTIIPNGTKASVTYPEFFDGDATIKCSISYNGYVQNMEVTPKVINCNHADVDETLICTACGMRMVLEFTNNTGTYYGAGLYRGMNAYINKNGGTVRLLDNVTLDDIMIVTGDNCNTVIDLNGFNLAILCSSSIFYVPSGKLTIKNGGIFIKGIDFDSSTVFINFGDLVFDSVDFFDNGLCGGVKVASSVNSGTISFNNISVNTACDVFATASNNSVMTFTDAIFAESIQSNSLLVDGAAVLYLGEGIYPCISVKETSIDNNLRPMDGLCACQDDGTYYDTTSFAKGENGTYNNVNIVPTPFDAEWMYSTPTIIKGVSTAVYVSATMSEGLTYTWSSASSDVSIVSYDTFAMVTYPKGTVKNSELYCQIDYRGYTVKLSLTPTLLDCEHSVYNNHGFCDVCNDPQPYQDQDGDGRYEINNVGNFVFFRDEVNSGTFDIDAELMCDLDLSIVCGEDLGSWVPIGLVCYKGEFYGNGYVIDNLWIYETKDDTTGLFAYLMEGSVYDLGVRGAVTTAVIDYDGTVVGQAAGLVGYMYLGNISGCSFEGTIYGGYGAGGLIANMSSGIVNNCYVNATVNTSARTVGGLVCYKDGGDLKNSYFVGSTQNINGNVSYLIGDDSPSRDYVNCYYLDNGTDTSLSGAASSEDFASGKVAYALNCDSSDDEVVWRQTLGTDIYPVYSGPIVYYGTEYKCDGSLVKEVYSNQPVDSSIPPHNVDDKGMCPACGQRIGYLKITKDDAVSYAMTLAEAAEVVGVGSATVTLLDTMGSLDLPVSGFGEVSCDMLILDLNGNDITYADSQFVSAIAGSFVIAGNGNVQCSDNGVSAGVVFKESDGNISLKGGKYLSGLSFSGFLAELPASGYYLRTETTWFTSYGPSSTSVKTWVEKAPFTVTEHPVSGTAWLGVPFVLSVEVQLLNPENEVSYAWYKSDDNTSVLGTASTLELVFTEAQSTSYYCVVSFDGFKISSGYATVTAEQCQHPEYINGFCVNCDEYQSAELVDDVYQIGNGGNLFWLASQINDPAYTSSQKAILTSDIDLENREWTTIEGFKGTFDGAGHTIKGFYISVVPTSGCNLGFFGEITSPAVVKNFTIDGRIRAITMGRSPDKVGVIAASGQDNMANGGTISGIISKITLESTAGIGIKHAGGVVGAMYGGSVEKCIFAGNIAYNGSTITELAGVVGYAQKGTINLCANLANVNSGVHTGGILGYMNKEGTNVTNCYNYGKISGRNSQWVGAIVGRVRAHGTIADNYYNTETTTNAYGTGSEGELTALTYTGFTSAQFISGEAAWTMNGKNDNGVWKQNLDGASLPDFSGDGVYYHIDLMRCDEVLLEYHFENVAHTEGDIKYADHEYNTDGVCVYCGNTAVAAVTLGDTVTYFEDIESALSYIQSGTDGENATLKLLSDTQLDHAIYLDSGNITLDLNGKCFSFNLGITVDYMIHLRCQSFTIIDTSVAMNGELCCESVASYFIKAYENTSIFMNSGTVRTHFGAFILNGCRMEQNGGTIIGEIAVTTFDSANYTINGGTIEAFKFIEDNGTATVNIYAGDVNCVYILMSSADANGTLNIRGGTFVYDAAKDEYMEHTNCIYIFKKYTVQISGGSFTSGIYAHFADVHYGEPLTAILANGYAFRNVDGEVVTLTENQYSIFQPITVSECEVVIEITWGTLEFTYREEVWDTETLTYDSGWICDDGANQITVSVKCGCEVAVIVECKAINSVISTAITDENGIQTNGAVIPAYREVRFYLSLTGIPDKEYYKEPIGKLRIILG